MAEEKIGLRGGLLQLIQKLGQPLWIVQKEPANHCLKSRCLSVGAGIAGPWAPTSSVATAAHPVALLLP